MTKQVAVIGSGIAGLSAASHLAKNGYDVTVFEKNDQIGGRARQFEEQGFVFDMGPSWYWMPEVFENHFKAFGKKVADYYTLKRLDPSYRVYFDEGDFIDVPADLEKMKALFEEIEPGSSIKLEKFLKEAAYKYNVGMNDLVRKPALKLGEFVDMRIFTSMFKMDLFQSVSSHVRKYFKNSRLIQLLEFPVLFLGAAPANIPALYTLMNYADISLGTWYPMGGMHEIIKGMHALAVELGVKFEVGADVEEIRVEDKLSTGLIIKGELRKFDGIIGSGDYHSMEQDLLSIQHRNYTTKYWDKKKMAPSSLLFYLGVDAKIDGLQHHNLMFDADFDLHSDEIYAQPKWPTNPLFYVCAPSKTDPSVAPEGKENLFLLVPIAPGLHDSDSIRERYFDLIMDRLESLTGQEIRSKIIYKRSYAISNFIADYRAFRGNAYGLANTLDQTAIFKPSIRNKKIKNLYYTGQLTVPGPGVPPSIISGEIVATEFTKQLAL
jgi:phytoene desaturase